MSPLSVKHVGCKWCYTRYCHTSITQFLQHQLIIHLPGRARKNSVQGSQNMTIYNEDKDFPEVAELTGFCEVIFPRVHLFGVYFSPLLVKIELTLFLKITSFQIIGFFTLITTSTCTTMNTSSTFNYFLTIKIKRTFCRYHLISNKKEKIMKDF